MVYRDYGQLQQHKTRESIRKIKKHQKVQEMKVTEKLKINA